MVCESKMMCKIFGHKMYNRIDVTETYCKRCGYEHKYVWSRGKKPKGISELPKPPRPTPNVKPRPK